MAELTTPRAGDLLRVGPEASVQFIRPILFRVIRVLDDWTRTSYDGWIWLEGYQLDSRGDAVARRAIFVIKAGLRAAPAPVVVGQPRRRSASSRRATA
ncbi:hypothetical protein [Micromonospora sp. C95]|uniref:hypothetical protein n=1 Tax=Micromonospora sp. C95 TaxID=2824882 RepID=UPI001B386CFF|nr:hypothetical protein [Micromonospora sp. C95]MBQ1024635.1 hypothetical protein [Micromonospora sp. C95]